MIVWRRPAPGAPGRSRSGTRRRCRSSAPQRPPDVRSARPCRPCTPARPGSRHPPTSRPCARPGSPVGSRTARPRHGRRRPTRRQGRGRAGLAGRAGRCRRTRSVPVDNSLSSTVTCRAASTCNVQSSTWPSPWYRHGWNPMPYGASSRRGSSPPPRRAGRLRQRVREPHAHRPRYPWFGTMTCSRVTDVASASTVSKVVQATRPCSAVCRRCSVSGTSNVCPS